jgi:hypothetical protein
MQGLVHSSGSSSDAGAAAGFEGLSRPVSRYAASGGALDTPDLERPEGATTGKAR